MPAASCSLEIVGHKSLFSRMTPRKLESSRPARLAFWTVAIGAGVVSVALMAAVVTLLQMATQNSRPADLDRSHYAMLPPRHRSAIVQAIIGAVAAENIRYFQPRAIHFPAFALQAPG
jgi:sterol desaturase/sphingolipid hydroxylase (fatty acid hydroxylase superfamily)